MIISGEDKVQTDVNRLPGLIFSGMEGFPTFQA
jgi:hypothetical protein